MIFITIIEHFLGLVPAIHSVNIIWTNSITSHPVQLEDKASTVLRIICFCNIARTMLNHSLIGTHVNITTFESVKYFLIPGKMTPESEVDFNPHGDLDHPDDSEKVSTAVEDSDKTSSEVSSIVYEDPRKWYQLVESWMYLLLVFVVFCLAIYGVVMTVLAVREAKDKKNNMHRVIKSGEPTEELFY
ncbi:hypothetical protein JTB14_004575 [Gonioctena quinquepunctata]|nr:hypothetical protein JTB14_004575 [Gonioctena quinquepunctata]